MRYEFERGGTTVATVLWEGPGQVFVQAEEESVRRQVERFFHAEVTYLGGGIGFEEGAEALETRRRDWNPWEFERSCRNLAHRMDCTVRRVETGPVEEPREVVAG